MNRRDTSEILNMIMESRNYVYIMNRPVAAYSIDHLVLHQLLAPGFEPFGQLRDQRLVLRVLRKAYSFRAPVEPILRPGTGVRFQQANTHVDEFRSFVAVPKACRPTCSAKLSPNPFSAFVAFQSACTEA